MYLDTISLRNIRGFEELDFSLKRPDGNYSGWTVFTGDNGSGKSTLLKAIALALVGRETARSLQPSFHRWVRQGATEGSIQIEIEQVPADDKIVDSGKTPSATHFPAKLLLKDSGRDTALEAVLPPGKPANYKTPDRSIWANASDGWFCCGYGPFRRVFGASPEATRHMVAESTERFVTMFQEAASLAEVDQWLRGLSHKALENKGDYAAQRDLILKLLDDDLMPNAITVDGVDSDGLWLKDRNGVRLAWSEMSDGYRSALALLADILRHLISEFGLPGLTAQDDNGLTYINRSGVVLIDEIDAHLHPEWQREIGFWLKRHFPKIQFLVTTHSPLICQAADPNGLFVLPEPASNDKARALTAEEYQLVIASRPDTILLSPAFGLEAVRSPKAVDARVELSRLRSKQRQGGKLTPSERLRLPELKLFNPDEEI